MGNDIPSNQPDLTGSDSQENLAGVDPMQPGNSGEAELDPKTKEGFQRLLAKRDKELREAQERSDAAQKELKAKKLQELDETDRLKAERDEALQKAAMAEIKVFVTQQLMLRKIPLNNPLAEIAMESPWAIPAIKRSLGDSPSWDEVIRVIKEKLPAYLDTLDSNKETTPSDNSQTPPASSEPSGFTDPERQAGNAPKRVWSQREIAKMSPEEYAKYSKDIHLAMVEGRITA